MTRIKSQNGRELWIERISLEDARILRRLRLVVAIFVFDRHQRFAEERVSLTPDLHKLSTQRRVRFLRILRKNAYAPAASSGVHPHHLPCSTELGHRNIENYGVDVESPLTIERLVRPGEAEIEIEDALNVRVKAIVPLARENLVAAMVSENRLLRVTIEHSEGTHALSRWLVPVIILIVEASQQSLIVRRNERAPKKHRRIPIGCFGNGISLGEILVGVARIINFSSIGGRIEHDERRVHMTRGASRRRQSDGSSEHCDRAKEGIFGFHFFV